MATSLSQLRTEFQFRWDVTGSTVLSTGEQNTLLNAGYRALWGEVTSVNKYFRVNTDSFVITTGQTRPLQPDYQETVLVRRDPGTDQQVCLTKFGPKSATQMYMRTYRLQGSNLVIEPVQRAAGTYAHDYVPQPPVLTLDADQLDPELDQFREYIVVYSVIEGLSREESDASQFFRILYGVPGTNEVGVQGRVKLWAAGQRTADPDTIEDVRRFRPWMPTPP